MKFGAPHRHYAVTDSTNTRARELAAAGAPGGTIVTAAVQTAGRGRQGRVWTAPAGKALLYSAVLRPFDERHALLPLAVPLAVCDAAEELRPGIECAVKWPNDVWLDESKLAGILIETRTQDRWAVIGVGLNLTVAAEEFPTDLRQRATSLFPSNEGGRGYPRRSNSGEGKPRDSLWSNNWEAHSGIPAAPLRAAAALSRHLESWLKGDPQAILDAWRNRDALSGREVAWDGGSGVADGVDGGGCLVVVSPGGGRTVLSAGEVHLRL